ncbi:Hypothetical protein D9617_1g084010 [Elsinoe fawcettii]|nr:Hypothetical protein D9617_1g084010 [Elsinoe fawcettii]
MKTQCLIPAVLAALLSSAAAAPGSPKPGGSAIGGGSYSNVPSTWSSKNADVLKPGESQASKSGWVPPNNKAAEAGPEVVGQAAGALDAAPNMGVDIGSKVAVPAATLPANQAAFGTIKNNLPASGDLPKKTQWDTYTEQPPFGGAGPRA